MPIRGATPLHGNLPGNRRQEAQLGTGILEPTPLHWSQMREQWARPGDFP